MEEAEEAGMRLRVSNDTVSY